MALAAANLLLSSILMDRQSCSRQTKLMIMPALLDGAIALALLFDLLSLSRPMQLADFSLSRAVRSVVWCNLSLWLNDDDNNIELGLLCCNCAEIWLSLRLYKICTTFFQFSSLIGAFLCRHISPPIHDEVGVFRIAVRRVVESSPVIVVQ